jgi:hypothetical protein
MRGHGGTCVFRLRSRSCPCTRTPAAITSSGVNKAMRNKMLNNIARPTPEEGRVPFFIILPQKSFASEIRHNGAKVP